ncbi:hypothetical protein DFI_09380 [Deinococcus ficus]|uniref:Ig-like domain-containing protein n=2 Tax=Deinococcus ficus TaxID=317577 RepID=A0A221SX47_9DEIO|nr:hypothetical protein DFI_09380 [Deinococcus ficus]
MKMKKLLLLTLPLIVTACTSGDGGFGASVVNVTASPDQIVTVNSTTTTGTTNYTFTNKAGSSATTINTATLSWKDTTGATRTETVAIPGFTLPAGFTCAAAGADPYAQCNYNDAGTTAGDRSVTRAINDAELFAKVFTANQSVTALPVTVQFNSTANALNFTFNSANTTGGGEGDPAETAPAPLLTVNTTGTQPYSGNLSVSISGNFAVTSTVKTLVLQVTDNKGNIDNTTYTSTNPSATFSIDTSKYPDGALTLRAIAITASGLTGTSAPQTVQIQNVSAPVMQILSPDSGATLTGPSTVRVQIRQSTSTFTLADLDGAGNDVRIDVRDFRGQIVKTTYGQAIKVSDGIYEAFIPLDLIGSDFSSNAYTITATAQATLNDGTSRNLNANTSVSTQVSDNKPPALSIIMPAYITDPYANLIRPTISRNSAFMIQASDDNGVSSLRVDFVCDPATALANQQCPVAPYTYNIPVGKGGVIQRVFDIGALMDGQPYIQNGNYTMRITAYDGANANIQEMPVQISRDIQNESIAGLSNQMSVQVVPDFTPGALNPTAATWSLVGTPTHDVRVVTLAYDNTVVLAEPTRTNVAPIVPAGTPIGITQSFAKEGSYGIAFIVEDLVTGNTHFYKPVWVDVKKNPS